MSRNTNFLVALGVLAVAMTQASLAGQARETTATAPQTTSARARVDTVFLPRAADEQTMVTGKVDLSAMMYAMTHTVFEAEDWGDIPKLGLSVQNMTPFGSTWSGNKQIFWNPIFPGSFKWDFKVPGAKTLSLDLTAAPDYGKMKITLVCYKKTTSSYYLPVATQVTNYDGYATSVRRQRLALFYPVSVCAKQDAYRLIFTLIESSHGRLGGIDRIVVSK